LGFSLDLLGSRAGITRPGSAPGSRQPRRARVRHPAPAAPSPRRPAPSARHWSATRAEPGAARPRAQPGPPAAAGNPWSMWVCC